MQHFAILTDAACYYINYINTCSMCFIYAACGINCHTKCAKNMPNLCGVNEKLLSEALKNVDEVKKNKKVSTCFVEQVYECQISLKAGPD